MTLPNSILYILVFIVSIARAAAVDFPFAKDTFDNDGKLKEWNLQDVRLYRDETIGDIAGKDGAAKDDAAKSEKLGYPSPRVESKYFETDIDLTDVSGVVYVAIHVDDIANLTATEINDAGVEIGTPIPFDITGSALWRAEKSYKEFPNSIPGGKKYRLKLHYTNTINLTERYNGLIDDDGVTVFLVHQGSEMKLDLKIASFQDKPDLAEDKNSDGSAANPPHEMDPGSVVLAPVEGYHTPGTRSKLTLTSSTAVTGEFRLNATTLPNVEIYEASEGGEPIPLQKTWQASEFPGTVTYYVGAKEFTPTQAAEIGTLVFSYHETSSESEALSEDKVKVTIEPAAIDTVIVRYSGDAEDLPDDLDPVASELHDMEPGGIVITSIETDGGIVHGVRTRLTLDVVNVPSNTGTYKLTKTDLANLVFYTDATGDAESNLEWTDADFEGNKKVTLYLGAKPMKIGEPEQSGILTFTYKREASSNGLTYEVEDKVKVTINTPVDIDVDSNNGEGFEFTWGSDDEDKIEVSDSLPGKIIAVPLNPDADKDGVPDALDGFGRGGKLENTKFVQMVVSIPATCDPDTARVVLDYKMSDPRGLAADATIAPSGFRIWTANAEVARSTAAIPEAATAGTGYFVPAGEEIPWKDLAANCEAAKSGVYQGPAIILYIETVLTKADNASLTTLPFAEREPITITTKPEYQNSEFNTSDTVNIGVRCTGGVKITGPKAIVVNDNHHNRDASGNQIDKWDYTNDRTGTLDPDVLPIAIEVTALDQDVWVTLSSEAMKGLGEPGTPTTGGLIDGVFPGDSEPAGTATDPDGQSKKGWKEVPYTFKVNKNTTFKQNLYIEGQRHSATLDDVVIKLETTGEGIEAGDPKTCIATTEFEHKMTVYQVDLDVDSNNTEGFVFAPGSDEEDWIEESNTLPGKIIVTSLTVDTNEDSIDDYQNGVDGLPPIEGARFTPMILLLPEPYDPLNTKIILNYPEAKPDEATPLSGLRVWKLNASEERFIPDDLVLSESPIVWADLFDHSVAPTRQIKLYIEVVNIPGSPMVGKKEIIFTAEKGKVTQAKDTINLTLTPVDFITPAGDPVKFPVDAGIIPASTPDGANEFTFNDDASGMLVIRLKAKVPGIGSIPTSEQAKFAFDLDPIGNSTFTWAGANPNGKVTVSGDFITASATYTGLPKKNSDFGLKLARVKFKGDNTAETKFEVFFAKDATNHPDAGQGTTPNWFFYWQQFIPLGRIKTLNFIIGSGYGSTEPVSRTTEITQLSSMLNDETGHRGLHTFYETIEHESYHIVLWEGWWGVGGLPTAVKDTDSDTYPDSFETSITGVSYGFVVGNDDNYSGGVATTVPTARWLSDSAGYNYEEDLCRAVERALVSTKYDDQDWSFDVTGINQGKNHK